MPFSANDKQNETERSSQKTTEPIIFYDSIKQNETERSSQKTTEPITFYDSIEQNETERSSQKTTEPITFYDSIKQNETERSSQKTTEPITFFGLKVGQEDECVNVFAITEKDECFFENPAAPSSVAITPNIQQVYSNPKNSIILPHQQHTFGNISNNDNGNSKNRHNAYNIAQTFMRLVHIKVCNESIYLYTESYYKKLSDSECIRNILKFCRTEIERSGTSKCLSDILNFIKYEPTLQYEPNETNNHFVSFLNCVLDTENNYICKHSPAYFTTYCLQCHYSTVLTAAPAFDAFLRNITGGDTILQERICEMIGYILTPDTDAKVLFLLQGCSNSGKSVLSTLIRSFFNEEAVSDMDVHELSERFAASDLERKALCISPDLPSEPLDAKSVSKLKQFTGNDMVSADVKYKDRTKFKCSAKFVLVTNHPFLIRGNDEAFFKRVVAIPFKYSVPKDMRDYRLPERLKYERDAIAARAISAYFRLKKNNYSFAGIYDINSPCYIHRDAEQETNINSLVYLYLINQYEPCKGETVFIADIYNDFINEFAGINIPLNLFSGLFCGYAAKEYNANKERRRRSGSNNPTSCISGIRRKTV